MTYAIKRPFPCPACNAASIVRGGNQTKSGFIRYRHCDCGCRFVTEPDPDQPDRERLRLVLAGGNKDDESIEAECDPMDARLPLKQLRRLIVLSLVADYQLCRATTGRFEVDEADAPALARMARRKAA